MKYVICYSGGKSSSECALSVAAKYGPENVILLNHNITPKVEQQCTKKLKDDVAEYLGLEITYANHKDWEEATPIDVCLDAGAWKSGKGPILCTNRLKTEPFKRWMEQNDPDKENIYVYGFDMNEQNRINRRSQIMGMMGYKTMYPMTWDESEIVRLEDIGIDPGKIYDKFNHSNCFSGDTNFITDKGIFNLRDKVGETVNILNNSGFNPAVVKKYGKKELMKVILSNGSRTKEIMATPDHRWMISRYDNNTAYGYIESTTEKLKEGNRIQTCFDVPEVSINKEAFRHGFIFGDGNLYNNHVESWETKSRAYIADCKSDVLVMFDSTPTNHGYLHGFDESLKTTMPISSDSMEYKIGFIAGLVASDGCVSRSGISISNKSKEVIDKVVELCQTCGLVAWSIGEKVRSTNYKKDARISTMFIPKSSFKVEWLIRQFHKDRFGEKRTKPKSWKVESVEKTGVHDETYCVEVIGEEKFFTLAGNVYTGNCIGCLKAGWQHWYIVYCERPDLWEHGKEAEEEIGYAIHKDNHGPVYLADKEEMFSKMKACGVEPTEKINSARFWADAKKAVREYEFEMSQLSLFDADVCLDCTL